MTCCQHLAYAANQVPVWGEATIRKVSFQLCNDCIKLANQLGNLLYATHDYPAFLAISLDTERKVAH
jgi:hypothetical protein